MRRALFLVVLAMTPVSAQTVASTDATVYAAPSGAALGTLRRGTTIRPGATQGAWTAVVLDGWIVSTRLSSRIDSLDRVVRGTGTAPLRTGDGANESVLADLEVGARMKRLADRNGWTHVRRTVWVRTASIRGEASASRGRAAESPPQAARGTPGRASITPPPTARPPAAAPPTEAGSAQRLARETALRAGPAGAERATIRAGANLETLARDGGWVRVRLEGWVSESDLAGSDSGSSVLSASELRADPNAHKGKVVRWEVQAVSVQRADALRRAMAPDEQYLLARGPKDEGAILYVVLPRALVDQIRGVPPLSSIIITARVRDGRSPPVGAPLLDLISFTRVQ
jgi:hypothetical protein